jgi:polysaccharide pyruvyl transferase WcaK-like protein
MVGPVVSYLGWHGRGNVGDDAIYDAVRAQLPGAVFVDFPHHPHEQIYAAATGLNPWMRRSSFLIGGGTLAGRIYFRKLVNRALGVIGDNASFAIGIGVEDPGFQGFRSGSENNELMQWLPVLSKFHTVSVRGPRSAELLSDIGLDVQVSGDPALLLPSPVVAPLEGLIGVNLGFGDDLWGHDPATLASEMNKAMAQLSAAGYRFSGILMNSDDQHWTEMALDGIPADIVRPLDAAAAAAELARCSVAVVSRLHAGILAALSGTPVISLEYQPKCRDFALSIDDERSLIRTDAVTGSEVVDRVHAALADAPGIRAKTNAAVAVLRERLLSDYAGARSQLGLVNH